MKERVDVQVEIRFGPNRSVKAIVAPQPGVTFEDVAPRLKALARVLQVASIPLEWSGEPEQHTHGPQHGHAHAQQHAR